LFFIAFYKRSFGELFSALLTYFSIDSIGKIPLFNYNLEPIFSSLWNFIKNPIKSFSEVMYSPWDLYYKKY